MISTFFKVSYQMIVLWDDDNSKYSYRSYDFHELIATS